MSAANAPFGMRPSFHPTGLDRAKLYQNGLASGFATGILKYQPVAINPAGRVIAPIAASGVDFIGVFAGVDFIDPTGKPVFSNFWAASTAVMANTPVNVWVWDDPNIEYEIQADGSVAQAAGFGNEFNFSAVTAGSTFTGLSAATLAAAGVGTGVQGMVRCIDKSHNVDNDWGDAFTVLVVQVARHQYTSNKVAV